MTALEYYRKKPHVVDALLVALPEQRKVRRKTVGGQAKISRFLQENESLRQLDDHLSAFNIFSAINVSGAEIRHSNFLAWLLAPHESHGLGRRFLHAFLRVITDVAEETTHSTSKYGKLENWNLDEVVVKPEFSRGSRLNRIDIVITLPKEKAVIVIENKLHSDQRKGQLANYRDLIEGDDSFIGFKKVYVFLTLKGINPDIDDFLPVTYNLLANRLTRDMDAHCSRKKVDAQAMLVQHYLSIIRGDNDLEFNLFRALKAEQKELRHSDMIAWLLNPCESHDLDSTFLTGFQKLLMGKAQQSEYASVYSSKTEIAVHREYQNVIDILVISESEKWLIAIENKWGSKESEGQLISYRTLLAAQYPDFKRCHVFLTHSGAEPSDSTYIAISYTEIVPLVIAAQMKIGGEIGLVSEQIALFTHHYFQLITLQLKCVIKAKVKLPDELENLCQLLFLECPQEVSELLGSALCWQRDIIRYAEHFLHRLVEQSFGIETFWNAYKVWLRFVPLEFDEIKTLRNSSADDMLANKLLQYTFYNIPFGNEDVPYGSNTAVAKKGIFLALGMAEARSGFASLRQIIYAKARENPEIFNAALSNELRGSRFSTLIRFKLASIEDFLHYDLSELESILVARFNRFIRHQHRQVVELLNAPEITGFRRLKG